MNNLDIAMLVFVALSTLFAFWKGFLHQAIGLAGWVIALVAARILAAELAPQFAGWLTSPQHQLAAAYGVIILVVILATRVLANIAGGLLYKIGLGAVDRFLGAFFGLLRGLIVLVLLVAVFSLTSVREHALWQESQFIPYLEQLRDWTAGKYEDYSKTGEF